MAERDVPPKIPRVRLEVVEDNTATSKCDEGYLRVKRRKLVARYGDGSEPSERFAYDVVERWNQDAVSVIPHFVRDGKTWVILRSSIRPPVALRPDPIVAGGVPLPPGAKDGELWEVCAGLVEKDERTTEGLVACVAREMDEELGLSVDVASIRALGGAIFPSAGIIGEVIYLYECEVDPSKRGEPGGDGSPLERHASIIEVPLARTLDWCEQGLIPDVKTELSIRRLTTLLSRSGRVA